LSAIAQRYAAALADVALERKNPEAVKRDLASFVDAFFEAADLRNFLDSPAVSGEVKRAVLAKIASKMEIDEAVRNFAYVLVDHRRTHMLREIQEAFGLELNARLGIADAEITSARELSGAEKKELTAALERRTGKKIDATFLEDKSLLGGAVVRVGSTIYDGSVRDQLNRLRGQLETE
jgi:F-type H+-transporting ATPase subunit delta